MQTISLTTVGSMAVQAKDTLKQLAAGVGREVRIFLHWSAGHYGQAFPDYHLCIDKDGEIYAMVDDLSEVLAHTWHQNTGSVAVSLLCCAFADTNDLGSEPPTEAQIESMAKVVAALCRGLDLACDDVHVRTHAEQADLDEYGPATTCERWDLWFLHNGDAPGSGGDILRGKAKDYMQSE